MIVSLVNRIPYKFLSLPLLVLVAACGGPATKSGAFRSINSDTVDFWDRQTTENAEVLEQIVDEFNEGRDGLPINVIQSGNYGDIYTKSIAAIRAGSLPGMAVAYGNMTVEYANMGAVAELDPLIAAAGTGLTQEELDDFFPAVLEQNVYPSHGGKTLSFPYTKAVLVLYCNTRVMAEAGIESPPVTWGEFVEQCRAIKAKTGKHAFSLDVDASTINGMIFSMGGDIFDGASPTYDTPEARAALNLVETLFTEELAYQNPPRSFNDQTAFGNDEIAFALRASSSLPYFDLVMEGKEGWLVAPIPQTDPSNPATILYGANISIFNTTEEQVQTAWDFIKYFTSPEISVRWALNTGYLPYRKSAVDDPALQAFWGEWPYNRTAFDCLPFARPAPNIEGWQIARSLLENAVTKVVTGLDSTENAVASLQKEIDREFP